MISERKMTKLPLLNQLKDKDEKAGKDVTLKSPDAEGVTTKNEFVVTCKSNGVHSLQKKFKILF